MDLTRQTAAAWLGGGDVAVVREGELARLHTELDSDDVQCLRVVSDEPLVMLVGTEPAHLFRVTGDGLAVRVESFDRMGGRDQWSTPWGGPAAVRSLADSGRSLYADIHVGSIARSSDNGDSWEPVRGDIHPDVHQVATCSAAPDRIYANTADAIFISEDRGDSWRHSVEGFVSRYGRAVAVHPRDPDLLLASVSRGPHKGEGRLYRSADGGESWEHVRGGFPPFVEGNIDTFCLGFDDDCAWAAVSNTLYRSDDYGVRWQECWEAPAEIRAIACVRGG
ncbi:MAG: hypothetical protein VX733_13275 [Candidatus Latescibacterota bacterium]|nr:hypothetical protein [Candidatus Latescibacterota bacterium]